MALANGTRLGVYEIVDALGAGGMGEVYRARDTRLGRFVAIKVLPDALAADADRIARLEREAKALAALNHPHIAQIYGLERQDGPEGQDRFAIVLELVEGDTLAERIAHGPLALETALTIARQIADALETAHEKGIIHRDLKPANIKLTADDQVKVLDFGLAKALEGPGGPGGSGGSGGPGGLTQSPTLSLMATQAGIILGTASYMSPEQAKGFPADQRSDIFSFGVVMFEMLTGRQPFRGETAPEILASVLIRDADLATLPPRIHPRLVDLVKRCLQKNPKQRWQHIGDVRAELETIAADPLGESTIASSGATSRPRWRRAMNLAAAATAGAAIALLIAWTLRPTTRPIVTRFSIPLGEGQQFSNPGRQVVGVSPDGTKIVYVANQRLYLRSMWDAGARPIPQSDTTGGVLNPVFSPDGTAIAYFATADQTLKRIAVGGGAPVTLGSIAPVLGLSWTGNYLYAGQGQAGIVRVPDGGGKAETIVKAASGETLHGPQFLADHDSVLFTTATTAASADRWDRARIVVQSLATGTRTTLVEGGSDGRYLPTGHLVYALGGVVLAAPMNIRRPAPVRGPTPVLEGVRRAGPTGTAQFSVADNGTLVYLTGPATQSLGQVELGVATADGTVEPLGLGPGVYQTPRISPDGTHLAFVTDDGKEPSVWVYDLAGTSSARRLTIGGRNRAPVWSADGQRLFFQSDRGGDASVFWQRADGTGTAERLTTAAAGEQHVPETASPDGKYLLFATITGKSGIILNQYSFTDRTITLFKTGSSTFVPAATFSPDGHWVAYAISAGIGTGLRVYVQPFPADGTIYEIGNGLQPQWYRDGSHLFFASGGPGMYGSVSVTTRPAFSFGAFRRTSLPALIGGGGSFERNYDITPDGRFIVINLAAGTESRGPALPSRVEVVLNWLDELKQRVPIR
jgi:Tol biopolymer transport system component